MQVTNKDMIAYVKALQNGSGIDMFFHTELLPFTKKLYSQLSGTDVLPEKLSTTDSSFPYYCYNIMIYRACMSDFRLNLDKIRANYLGYLKKDTLFSRSLAAGNPFTAKRNLVELLSLVDATKNSVIALERFAALSEAIKYSAESIENIHPEHAAGFKAIMMGYSNILLAKFMSYNLPVAQKNQILIAQLFDIAKKSFQFAERLQTQEHDVSIIVYSDIKLPPPLPFKDLQTALLGIADLQSSLNVKTDEGYLDRA